MTFENYSVQYRELVSDSTQYSTISLPKLNFSNISITRKDNKRLPVGQMVVNNDRKIVSLNQKFISIWKLPQHVVQTGGERQVFQFIIEQLENPQSFLIDTRNVHEQRSLEIQDLVKLKDGRFFSHISFPQWLEKTVVGRVYRFRSLL
jgi:PAS domain-containing protein